MCVRVRLAVLIAAGALVAQPAAAGATSITEFPIKASMADPLGVTAGSDGNVWFTDGSPTQHAIGRITPAGVITEFTKGLTSPATPFDIATGPDGNVWFTATGSAPNNAIGRATMAGVITEFTTGLNPNAAPSNITPGPDGNLWFLDNSTKAIGRVTTGGVIKEFPTPDPVPNLEDLTAGPDGNMYFTDRGNTPAIGQVKPDGTITEFTTGLAMGSMPNGITTGSDSNLWFTDEGVNELGKATPSGKITETKTGLQSPTAPDGITTSADGNAWFEDNLGGNRAVGRITPAGVITEFKTGLGAGLQDDITAGPDGNIWIEQSMPGGIARVTPSGSITQFSAGLLPNAGADGDGFTVGPDGNLWFNDRGAKAIGKVSLQIPPLASTGSATAVTNTTAAVSGSVTARGAATSVTFQYGTTPSLGSSISAGTLPASGTASPVSANLTGLPAGTVVFYEVVAANASGTVRGGVQKFKTTGSAAQPHVVIGAIGNQLITLTNPSLQSCAAASARLTVGLTSAAVAKHGVAKLRFASAAFFIDKGVPHKRKVVRRVHGHRRKVTVVVFAANATAHRVPANESLQLRRLKSGVHALRVVVSFREPLAHHKSKTVIKTLTLRFLVC